MARRVSALPAFGTVPITSPDAGSTTSMVRPESAPTQEPPMRLAWRFRLRALFSMFSSPCAAGQHALPRLIGPRLGGGVGRARLRPLLLDHPDGKDRYLVERQRRQGEADLADRIGRRQNRRRDEGDDDRVVAL